MQWTVAQIVDAVRGRLMAGDPALPVGAISTDTRSLRRSDCFLALAGERFDGHDFIPAAVEKGAVVVLVASGRGEGAVRAGSVAVVEVDDTLYALGELARTHRARYSIPVAGITGSNGKTSTKELLAAILEHRHGILKNRGNLNNLIGVPLTLLTMDPTHEAAVIEMGINVPGEMARLVEIAGPTLGLITNIQPAHLEGLGSLDGILKEKGRLWDALDAEGIAVVNLDDQRLRAYSKRLTARTVTCSVRDPEAGVRVVGEIESDEHSTRFRMVLGTETVPVVLSAVGIHYVRNALAAAAAAWALGEPGEAISAGLAEYRPVGQRMQIRHMEDGRVLIDDTYNANPESMLAAVRTALAICRGRPCIAVLGEMRELGADSAALHRELGRRIGAMGLSGLITLGELAAKIGEGAVEAGMKPAACRHAKSHDQAVEWLLERKIDASWILVKGSRGMTMERVVEGMLGR